VVRREQYANALVEAQSDDVGPSRNEMAVSSIPTGGSTLENQETPGHRTHDLGFCLSRLLRTASRGAGLGAEA